MSDNPGTPAKAAKLTKSGRTSKPTLKRKAAEVSNSVVPNKVEKKKKLPTITTKAKAKDKNQRDGDVLKLNINENVSVT
jgi:uncharacterized protein YdaT